MSVGTQHITDTEAQAVAETWYRFLDLHVPAERFKEVLADNVELQYPEGFYHGFYGFSVWYERVIRMFFDEVHTLKQVKLIEPGDPATFEVVVHWQSSQWNPPEPRSERIDLESHRTWVIGHLPETGDAVIQRYLLKKLDFADDSARW